MNSNESKEFQYTYSAKEQAELKKIRDKYLSKAQGTEADKMQQILRLDASATKSASAISVCLGIVGTLIMGSGMSLIMTDLGKILSLGTAEAMTVGMITGIVGMVAVLCAYPLYHLLAEKKRKKIAPEILRLTEELISEKAEQE